MLSWTDVQVVDENPTTEDTSHEETEHDIVRVKIVDGNAVPKKKYGKREEGNFRVTRYTLYKCLNCGSENTSEPVLGTQCPEDNPHPYTDSIRK